MPYRRRSQPLATGVPSHPPNTVPNRIHPRRRPRPRALLNEPAGKATTTHDDSDLDPRDSDVANAVLSSTAMSRAKRSFAGEVAYTPVWRSRARGHDAGDQELMPARVPR